MLGERAPETGTWKNMRALAAAEIKRAWPSYATTALVTVFTGLVGSVFIAEAFPVGDRPYDTGALWTADAYLLCLGTGLAYNWVASGYWYLWRDPFADRLAFLRVLPVPAREVVMSRMLIMLICLPVYASLFFLPAYLIMSSFPGPFESFTYLWFVLIWAGYGLFSGGMMLHLELGYRGRTAFALYNLWFVVLALIFVSFVFGLGQSVVFGTADLARAYGPLPAALGFLAGALAFGALGSATVRRLRRRELA